jgi:predicted GIY-YIG superfamily endonuclease
LFDGSPRASLVPRFFVYILASLSRVLYTGVTRDQTHSARVAFERERQIKGWSREKKVWLIESVHAGWWDRAEDWFPKEEK